MTNIEQLEKAMQEAAEAGVTMLKKSQMAFDFNVGTPHHVAYTRTNASGTVSNVQAKGVSGYQMHKQKAAEATARAVDSPSHTKAASAHMEAILQAGEGTPEAAYHSEAYKHHMKMATELPPAAKQKVWGGTDSADGKFRFRDWESGDEVPNYEGEYTFYAKDGTKSQMHTWTDAETGERAHSALTKDEWHKKFGQAEKHQALIGGVHKVGNDLLNNPMLAEHHDSIKRKLEGLKANPDAKSAAQVAGYLKLIAGKAAPHQIGDTVHLGFGTKGGAGIVGKLTKIEDGMAHITNDEGRTFKGHVTKLSKP